ncbi:hypothetical protein AMECASPLE_035853 [Ameca splendens]|uniref:HMG box domain-containing protein n=1 Tax=Ameca splendens TaxID=208324 RepID=A0ABV0ZH56_9TELE
MSSVNYQDSRSSVSNKELIEEFDLILAEKGVKSENIVPIDWDIVEDLLREMISPSPPPLPRPPLPPVISAPPQITACYEKLDIWMSSGNDKDSESSVSDKDPMEEFAWILTEKEELLENLVPTDWDIVEDLLREKISPSPPLIVSDPPQFTSCNENSDIRTSSGNDEDSENFDSMKELMEDFHWIMGEEIKFENMVPTDWDNIQDRFREKVSPPPPPSPALPPCPSPPNVISAPPEFSINTNVVVSQSGDQDYMFRPPPPTFTPLASPAPPRPPVILAPPQLRVTHGNSDIRMNSVNDQVLRSSASNKELIEDAECLPPEKRLKFGSMVSTDWTIMDEFLGKKVVSPPPSSPPPPAMPAPPQFNINTNIVVSQDGVQNYMFWPPPPTFTPRAALPHPPVIPAPSGSNCNNNIVFSLGGDHGHMFWPPPPTFTPHPAPHIPAPPPRPPVIPAPSGSNCNNKIVFSLGGDHGHMFWPPPPTFTPHPAPYIPAPPPRPPVIPAPSGSNCNNNIVFSLGGDQGHMFRPPPPTFTPRAPPPLVLPAKPQSMIRPHSADSQSGRYGNILHQPAGGAHSQGQILNSLPIVQLPKNVILQPLGLLNGEVLYGAVPPPPLLNSCNSNSERKCEDKQDGGRAYVKKPPNAFMLFLKEQRPKVAAELNLNHSVAVNSIVGEKWKSLSEEQKAKYYDQARVEKQLHEQQHPEWSNTDNYGKKRKRIRQKNTESSSKACKTDFSTSQHVFM